MIVLRDYLKIRPDMPLIWKIMAIGVPSGVENGMFQFGKLAIQSTVSTMGTVAIAAQAMTNILESLNGVFGVGVGIGLMYNRWQDLPALCGSWHSYPSRGWGNAPRRRE